MKEKKRCPWLPVDRPLYVAYHDEEWGRASRDRRHLFEMICLEGAQAGLSWWTVLQKRECYRELFLNFEPERVAELSDGVLEEMLLNPGIIRHRGKVFAVRENARAWLRVEEERGDAVEWLWSFVGGEVRRNRWQEVKDYPTRTMESDAMSKALRKSGFNFVGSTTMYAFMQAVGMVDDHSRDCFLG